MNALWPAQEDLATEFKSDTKRLSDRDRVEAVVCLANTDGGTLFLGVEDDGTATGLNTARDLSARGPCRSTVSSRSRACRSNDT